MKAKSKCRPESGVAKPRTGHRSRFDSSTRRRATLPASAPCPTATPSVAGRAARNASSKKVARRRRAPRSQVPLPRRRRYERQRRVEIALIWDAANFYRTWQATRRVRRIFDFWKEINWVRLVDNVVQLLHKNIEKKKQKNLCRISFVLKKKNNRKI